MTDDTGVSLATAPTEPRRAAALPSSLAWYRPAHDAWPG